MTDTDNKDKSGTTLEGLALELQHELVSRYGLMLGGEDLILALGYRTPAAFRQAGARNLLPAFIFSIPQRKGRFALSREVARWIAQQRHGAPPESCQLQTEQVQ